jgi:hypothetical protein
VDVEVHRSEEKRMREEKRMGELIEILVAYWPMTWSVK